MRNLEDYGIPSCTVDIWEKKYSPYLLPVQKKAVKYYGILDYGNEKMGLPRSFASRNGRNGNQNLLVIAPPSSGKSFIGEMAAITYTLHQQKTIYLVPFPFMAKDKYNHFRKLYKSFGLDIVISSPNRKEDDQKIVNGDYDLAVIVYEKFNHFLLTYPDFLKEVSLLIIDEMQMINDYRKGPLLKSMIDIIQNRKPDLKIIALSAFMENLSSLKEILSARLLTSFHRPVELRKGIVREGSFKYIEHNTKKTGKEKFFKAKVVRDNCFEDYLKETVNYFIHKNESTLLFFPTGQEAREWAFFLSSHLKGTRADQAIDEFYQIEDAPSRKELLTLLEKGITYYNSDLTRKEKELIETYVRKREIKVVCATTNLAMKINSTFNNVILASNKSGKEKEYYQDNHQQSLSLIDIENIGGKAGILNKSSKDKTGRKSSKKERFGRLIFLAHNKLQEAIFKNLYFNLIDDYHQQEEEIFVENFLMRETSNRNYLKTNIPAPLLSPSKDCKPETRNPKPITILEISQHRPDRIIFEEKEIKVTAREFSLLYLLAQHKGEVISYEEILKELWKDEKDADAIYTRINYHICKIRKDILKIIDKKEDNVKKMKNIFETIPGRGLMLNIKEKELKLI